MSKEYFCNVSVPPCKFPESVQQCKPGILFTHGQHSLNQCYGAIDTIVKVPQDHPSRIGHEPVFFPDYINSHRGMGYYFTVQIYEKGNRLTGRLN